LPATRERQKNAARIAPHLVEPPHDGYPFSANRVMLHTRPDARLVPAKIPRSPACICKERSSKVHRRMIEGSKYAVLTS
jgi:hypothetical protein